MTIDNSLKSTSEKTTEPYQYVTSLREIKIRRDRKPLKLDWNESVMGPPTTVIKALRKYIIHRNELGLYSDVELSGIYRDLKKYVGISRESMLLVTNGSDAALELIMRTYCISGNRICIPQPTYSQIRTIAAPITDNIFLPVHENPFTINSESIIEWGKGTRLIYLANPNNPTGTFIEPSVIERFCQVLHDTLIILDEAYIEFNGRSSAYLTQSYNNLIITRTFSKAFALAGLRLGYIIASESIIQTLSKFHNKKSINRLALCAASAALHDSHYIQNIIQETVRAKEYVFRELKNRNIITYQSQANFIIFQVDDAIQFISEMARMNVYLRNVSSLVGMPNNSVRITIGSFKDMKEFIRRLDDRKRKCLVVPKKTFLSKVVNVTFFFKRSATDVFLQHNNREFFPQVDLDRYSTNKLSQLINFCLENNEFYAKLWKERGITQTSIPSISFLPIVEKYQLRNATIDKTWFSKNIRIERLRGSDTTGSSGEPFRVFFSKEDEKYFRQLSRRTHQWFTCRPGDSLLTLWRKKKNSTIESIKQKMGIFKRIGVYDINDIDASIIDDSKLALIVAEIEQFRPKALRGYVSVLWLLAQYMQERKITYLYIDSVITSAEYLPESVKEKLIQAFHAKVYNLYGSTETPYVACTCPESDLIHTMNDYYYIEIVDNNGKLVGPGTVGHLLITDLNRYNAPLIRYRIGDLAEWSKDPCRCKRGLKTLKNIYGRENDIFILPNDRRILSHMWHIYFRDVKEIKQFQVLQVTQDEIVIHYIPSSSFSMNGVQKIEALKKKLEFLFNAVSFHFENVDIFDTGINGKFQAVKSFVPHRFNEDNT